MSTFKFNPDANEYIPPVNLEAAGGAGVSNRELLQRKFRDEFERSLAVKAYEKDAKLSKIRNLPYLESISDKDSLFERFLIIKNDDFMKLAAITVKNAKRTFYSDELKRSQFNFVISSHGVSTRDLGFNSKIAFDKEKGNQEIIAYGSHGKTLTCHPGLQSQICNKAVKNKEINFVNNTKNTRERYISEFPYDYMLAAAGYNSFRSGLVLCSEPKNNIVISIDTIGKNILFSQVYELIHIFVDTYCELSGQKRNDVNIKVHLLFCRVSECEFDNTCEVNIDPKYIKVGGNRTRRQRLRKPSTRKNI